MENTMMRRVLVCAFLLLAVRAGAQDPAVLVRGNSSGSIVTIKVSSDGTVATTGTVTTDPDDGSIAVSQTNSNVNALGYAYDGVVWRRVTFGTAGSASTQVMTVQGIASMTPFHVILDSGSVSNTTFAATQSGTWTMQPGNTANTTPWLVAGTPCTLSRHLSVGTTEDETQISAVAGTLCGMSARNSHATADAYIKCTNATAANTTPGSTAIIYEMLVPHLSGFVDGNIDSSFSTALTCYMVLSKADNAVDEVGAGDVNWNIRTK